MKPEGTFHFRPGTIDGTVFDSVVKRDEYRLPQHLCANDRVVDIGGHIGSFTFAALSRGSEHVFAYEAEPSNFRCITQNLAQFINVGHLQARHCAVWRSDIKVSTLRFASSADIANTAGGGVMSEEGFDVEAVPFDQIVDEVTEGGRQRIRLMKIDCEGAEFPILLTTNRLGLIDEICGEFHEWASEYGGGEMKDLFRVGGHEKYKIETLIEVLQNAGFEVTSERYPSSHMGLFFARRNGSNRDMDRLRSENAQLKELIAGYERGRYIRWMRYIKSKLRDGR